MREQMFDLSELAGGAVLESFNYELQSVLSNILDPNTEAKKKREITIRLSFQPSADRTGCNIQCSVTSKLSPTTPIETSIYVERLGGSAIATERKQLDLFSKNTTEKTHA